MAREHGGIFAGGTSAIPVRVRALVFAPNTRAFEYWLIRRLGCVGVLRGACPNRSKHQQQQQQSNAIELIEMLFDKLLAVCCPVAIAIVSVLYVTEIA